MIGTAAPVVIVGETKLPLLATTWWLFVSLFVHLIASVVAIVRLVGVKAVAVIETVLVTNDAGCDAPVMASASVATAASTAMRIRNPLGLRRLLPVQTRAPPKSSAPLQHFYTGTRWSPRTTAARPGGTSSAQPPSRSAAGTSTPESSFSAPSSSTTTS